MSDAPEIITNGQPRNLIALCDLAPAEAADFDYIKGEDVYSPRLFRYKGAVYDSNEFTAPSREVPPERPFLAAWDGVQADTYFSGILIRYVDDFERVIVGRYFS